MAVHVEERKQRTDKVVAALIAMPAGSLAEIRVKARATQQFTATEEIGKLGVTRWHCDECMAALATDLDRLAGSTEA